MLKGTRPDLSVPVVTDIAASSVGSPGPAAGNPSLTISISYRYYVAAVIWLVLLFRFLDLQIISVLLEPIRAELALSDTQLGLLSGTAFAIFYGTLGVPVAWLADRYNRRNLIAACIGLWSAMTALCGLAGSATSLFLARVGTGVGEAGGVPPSYSLICDYFPAARRATIIAFLNSSVPAGVFAGFIVGGFINENLGWRAAFIIVGVAGLVVALLVRLTLREPVRGATDAARIPGPTPKTLDTLKNLARLRSYRHLVLASTLFTLGAMGSGIWIASFFIRAHGMPPAQVATCLAFVYGGGGIVGATLGGMFADRLVIKTSDTRWYAWFAAIAIILLERVSRREYRDRSLPGATVIRCAPERRADSPSRDASR